MAQPQPPWDREGGRDSSEAIQPVRPWTGLEPWQERPSARLKAAFRDDLIRLVNRFSKHHWTLSLFHEKGDNRVWHLSITKRLGAKTYAGRTFDETYTPLHESGTMEFLREALEDILGPIKVCYEVPQGEGEAS